MNKICSKCKVSKSISEFNKRKRSKDGYHTRCRKCVKEWRDTIKEKEAIYNAYYYQNNKDKILAKQQQDPNRATRNRGYYEKDLLDLTKVLKRKSDYFKWYKDNPGKRTANHAKYVLKKSLRTPSWLTEEDYWLIEQAYIVAQERSIKYGVQFHVDHIVPLNGKTVSGLHVPENLQVIPWHENLSKSNKF